MLSGGPNIIKNGLVLYLDAANIQSYSGSGTIWQDLTSNAIYGELISGSTFNAANGGSIVFDGTDDYISLGASSLLDNTINGSSNFTISYWVKCTQEGRILDCGNIGGDPNGAFELNIKSISVNNIGSTISLTASITLANWNYITITKDSSKLISWYLNGVFSNSDALVADFFVANNIWKIGRRAFNNTNHIGGNIASLKIYNQVLSVSDVLQNYNAQKSRFGLS